MGAGSIVTSGLVCEPGAPLPEEEAVPPDLELLLPARAENVAVVRHALGGLADVCGVSDQTLADIRLAVTEACTNVVVHAYPEGEGSMAITAALSDDHVELVVTDEGRGIVPRADSPGLGLGLPLIASLAESLELGSPNGHGSEVRMAFRTQPEPDEDAA